MATVFTSSGGMTIGNPIQRGTKPRFRSSGGSSGGSRSSNRMSIDLQKKAEAEVRMAKERLEKAQQEHARASREKASIAERTRISKEIAIQHKRLVDIRMRENQRLAEMEQTRIQNQIASINRSGGHTTTRKLTNKKGDNIETKIIYINKIVGGKKMKERVWEQKNLTTGEIKIVTYSDGRTTGGLSYSETKTKLTPAQELQSILDNNRMSIKEKKTLMAKIENLPINAMTSLTKNADKLRKERLKIINKKGIKAFADPRLKKIDNQLQSIAVAQGVISAGIGIIALPKTIQSLIRDPAQLKKVPASMVQSGKELGQLAMISPNEAIAKVGTELLLLKGTGKAFNVAGKISTKTANKILNANPSLLKIEKNLVKINKGKNKITLKVGGVKTFEESLSQQLKREGTKSLAVTSQGDKLVGLIFRKKVIRKPLPNEDKLNVVTKQLLKKFDKGKISNLEFDRLQRLIRKQTINSAQPKGVDLLERSLYFDPSGGLRKSRLKLKADDLSEASFIDLLRGKATIFSKKQKPQILVLEDMVEKLPRTKEFKSIINKLKKNKPLSDNELIRLSKFQVTPSGKLKPIGSTTYAKGIEREVTLAPSEAIKRVKKLGTLKVGDNRIPIIAIKIVKGKAKVNLIKKFEKLGDEILKLTKKKQLLIKKKKFKTISAKKRNEKLIKTINQKISKAKVKTKKIKITAKKKDFDEFLKAKKTTIRRRRHIKRKKVYPIRRKILTGISRLRPLRGRPKRPKRIVQSSSRVPTRPKRIVQSSSRVPTRPKRVVRPVGRVSTKPKRVVRPVGRVSTRPKKTTKTIRIRRPSKTPKRKKVIKDQVTFNVYGKSGKKFVKLNTKPLKRTDALAKGSYAIDNTTAKTFKITPAGRLKKVGSIPKREKNYFNRRGYKLREYKIRKGRKFGLQKKYIEKSKYGIDTKGEKKQLSLSKYLAKTKRPVKRKVKRRVTKRRIVKRKGGRKR